MVSVIMVSGDVGVIQMMVLDAYGCGRLVLGLDMKVVRMLLRWLGGGGGLHSIVN